MSKKKKKGQFSKYKTKFLKVDDASLLVSAEGTASPCKVVSALFHPESELDAQEIKDSVLISSKSSAEHSANFSDKLESSF